MEQITDRFKRSLDCAVTKITQWEHRERILAVYLYGSYARNEQSADSDIDLYIQTDTKTDRKMIRELIVLCNPEDYRLPEVEVKVEQGVDSLMKNDLFHENIRKDGILLWKRK